MSGATSGGDKPSIEIVSDEDWKTRVKEEDAQRDAASAPAAAEPETEADSAAARDLPPATLATLLQMLSSQAILAMGLIPAPDGQRLQELPLAKHFIDLLAVLEAKCGGNLSADEARFLDQSLHELRMAYVEVSRRAAAAKS
jgi:hypothetical protein